MMALIAVLRIAANISSAMASSEFWMMSKVTGSLIGCMGASLRLPDMDVAVSVDGEALAGMDDDRGRRVLNNGRAHEAHAGFEPFGVVNVRLMRAFERIVDQPAALPRAFER